jgi:intein/homing endonuclease
MHELGGHLQERTFEPASFSVMSRTGTEVANQVYRGATENGYRIETALGYVLEGSERHPILVCTTVGTEVWKKLPEIVVGDVVILRVGTRSETPQRVRTDPFLDSYQRSTAETGIRLPDHVDEEVSYLLGSLVGDGSYTSDSPRVEMCKCDPDVVGRWISIFTTSFGVTPTRYEKLSSAGNTIYRIVLEIKQLRAFLLWCGLERSESFNKTIPWSVRRNTAACQAAFLRGLYDTDGGVNGAGVHLTTTSAQVATDAQVMLANLGLVASRHILRQEDPDHPELHEAYRINLSGDNARKFKNIIGFSHPRKAAEFDAMYPAVRERARSDGVPKSMVGVIPGGQKCIAMLYDELKGGKRRLGGYSRCLNQFIRRVARGTVALRVCHLRYLIDNIPNLSSFPTGRVLYQLHEDGVFFDPVASISRKECQMYDICVPTTHAFVSGAFVSHNSQGLTIPKLCVDLGNSLFEDGQAYVATSRGESLEGLLIRDLDFSKFRACTRVQAFYKVLAAKIEKRERDSRKQEEEKRSLCN